MSPDSSPAVPINAGNWVEVPIDPDRCVVYEPHTRPYSLQRPLMGGFAFGHYRLVQRTFVIAQGLKLLDELLLFTRTGVGQ